MIEVLPGKWFDYRFEVENNQRTELLEAPPKRTLKTQRSEGRIKVQFCFRLPVGADEGEGFVASLLHLHGLSVRIEFAHEAVSVLSGRGRYVGDKRLDEVSAGSAQSFRAAEVCGICLNESRIEVVLGGLGGRGGPAAEVDHCLSRYGISGLGDRSCPPAGPGELERAPNSSTEQRPIPYAFRCARLTARVSATRISAPRTREDTFEGSASP